MLVNSPNFRIAKLRKSVAKKSLSTYFPKGTTYFYGYPSGEDSGFLNRVPPSVEELVSARPLICGGNDISVLCFDNSLQPETLSFVRNHLSSPLLSTKQVRSLPAIINVKVTGKKRNQLLKETLITTVLPGTLVMAQPFLDDELSHLYQISPKLTQWLNDKQHMTSYVPERLLPAQYGCFKNGNEFASSKQKIKFPCVVKVSSSSAGDGVYICKDSRTLGAVKVVLAKTQGAIIVEQYIYAKTNFGVQFGIAENPESPIEIIGINKQLTTPEGEFIGGVIEPGRNYPELNVVKEALLTEILPQVRELGWFGVGCFDVLMDSNGKCFIIDCNFRMTGMTAYLMLVANGYIRSPMVSFTGEFHGTLAQLEQVISIVELSGDTAKPIQVINLAEHGGVYRFNAAILFKNSHRVNVMARQLQSAGIVSKALDQLTSSRILHSATKTSMLKT